MSYTARPPFTGGMSNQNQQQQQSGQSNNANIGASGIPNMPIMSNAAASKNFYFINAKKSIELHDSVKITTKLRPCKTVLT